MTGSSSVTPHPRRGRRLAIVMLALATAGVAAWQIAVRWPRGAKAPRYSFAEARRGDVIQRVTASGTLRPVVQVEVGSQVSGRVKALYVDFNDPVKKGQLIALIDPEVFESNVQQAQARLTAARADLSRALAQQADARLQYDRLAGLGDRGAVARAEVDTAFASARAAEAAVGSARAQVTLAQAALDQTKANLAYTRIISPIDGVVVSRNVELGQTVAASLQAPTLFVIAEDLRKMEVHTSVAEADVGQIAADQRVEFTVDAFPERTFVGRVRQVRYAAETVSNVVTDDAVVAVDNDDLKLRPGMTATTSFVVAEAKDTLTVPVAALRYRPKDAPPGRAVWVLREGAPARVEVKTGLGDGQVVQIVSGALQPGDRVIVGDGQAPAGANGAGAPSQRGGRPGPPRLL